MAEALTPELIRRALTEREPEAVRAMVRALTPILQGAVARALIRRRAGARGRDIRQEVEDLTQEVFALLLADGGRRLLAWKPELGAATTFFGLIAQRQVSTVLASRRQNPWTEDPTASDALERSAGGRAELERLVGSRQLLRVVGERLRDALSERDQLLFDRLYVRELSDEEVRAELDLGRDALYQCRRRLRQRVRAITIALLEEEKARLGGAP